MCRFAHSYFRVPFYSHIAAIHRLKKFMSKGECREYAERRERIRTNDRVKRIYVDFRYIPRIVSDSPGTIGNDTIPTIIRETPFMTRGVVSRDDFT